MNEQPQNPLMRHCAKWLLAIPVFFLSACGTPQLHIQGGGFRNLTDFPIKNVELRVVGTGKLVSCSYIAPQGYFGTLIPLKPYEQNQIEVNWTYKAKELHAGPFLIPLPDPLPDEPVVAVVRFDEASSVSAGFVPLSEIPKRYLR